MFHCASVVTRSPVARPGHCSWSQSGREHFRGQELGNSKFCDFAPSILRPAGPIDVTPKHTYTRHCRRHSARSQHARSHARVWPFSWASLWLAALTRCPTSPEARGWSERRRFKLCRLGRRHRHSTFTCEFTVDISAVVLLKFRLTLSKKVFRPQPPVHRYTCRLFQLPRHGPPWNFHTHSSGMGSKKGWVQVWFRRSLSCDVIHEDRWLFLGWVSFQDQMMLLVKPTSSLYVQYVHPSHLWFHPFRFFHNDILCLEWHLIVSVSSYARTLLHNVCNRLP